MPKKVHLVRRGRRMACGVLNPERMTTVASEVTCGGCMRTLAMADAEMRERLGRKAKKRSKFPEEPE